MGNIISCLPIDSIRQMLSFVGGEARYVWSLEDNLDDLRTEKENLDATKEGLLNKVKLAEQQPRTRRTTKVAKWFVWVEEMGTKVAALQQVRDQEIDMLCLGGFCSKDLKSTYDFGKRVKSLKKDVIKLRQEGEKFKTEDYAEEIPENPAVELPVEQTVVGQESVLDRVWRKITDKEKDRDIIGLCGTGGVGKTTLLKQVNNNFRAQQHHFDVVIWAVVSREPNLEKIQADIGKRIGYSASWQNKSFEDKALDITSVLSQKRFVLLLDDIWQYIDLKELGVPLQSLNNGSKVIFTTRSQEVCGKMKAVKLEVPCLRDEEAWKLFKEEVGRYALDSHHEIPELAKTIARECRGLPLALKTVGRVMASITNPEEWKRAFKILNTSASKFAGMKEEVFSRLKFSYDSLPRNELQSCLLYCCLFPEDCEIPKTALIDYWISERFLTDFDDGYAVIGDLLRACLLEEEGDHVKMHDMIRDMALWIAEENFLVLTRVQLIQPSVIEKPERVKRISLMENKIQSLSEIPTCLRLQTLLLDRNEVKMISGGFFQFMPSLRVLSLRENYFLAELPSDISNLVLLEHLDLSYTRISVLPEEMKALVNLRYLNLERTLTMVRIPQQLISNFSKLQVLKMVRCGLDVRPIMEEGNILSVDAESLMKELQCLEHLNYISLSLKSWRAVQNFLKYPKLVSSIETLIIEKCETLQVNLFLDVAYMMENFKGLIIYESNLEEWKINSTKEVQKLLQSDFHSLRTVNIGFCKVKDLTWLAFAPNLKKLYINCCDDMEKIISVEKLSEVSEIIVERNIFAQLESLWLSRLRNLQSIYRNLLPFPQLKKIDVQRCRKLKKLPFNSSSANNGQIVIEGSKEWWEQLQWEDQATQNAFPTCFVSGISFTIDILF